MKPEEMKYCQKLLDACELSSDEQFEDYLEAINVLKGSQNPEVLQFMLKCFRDNEAGEIQYELVEICESFPDDIYIDIFMDEGEQFYSLSPMWFELMFQSILNTKNCWVHLKKKFPTLPAGKREFYLNYLKRLSTENRKYGTKLANLEKLTW